MKAKSQNVLLILFFEMFRISAFTFGGGFVIATFVKKQFADKLHWIDEKEMLDLIALGQSSPGAVAVNIAILTGWRVFGFLGMVVAVIATILPPIIIISAVSLFYSAFAANRFASLFLEGMRSGVAAVILSVSLDLIMGLIKEKSVARLFIMVLIFIASFCFRVNTIILITAALAIGIIVSVFRAGRSRIGHETAH